ncbi:MAG: ABC transporter permease [Provencibacterium sp.]|jgi:D-methionine transport system permease protein|nr:ABC transporter permease [Provencibacterium sp.]
MWNEAMLRLLLRGIGETFYMTLGSTLFAYIIGLPLGLLLVICAPDGLAPKAILYKTLDIIVNITRSIPFLVLMISVIPFTRAVVGTSIGSTAAIVPLVLSAAPFVARLVESSIREVDPGVVEAAQSMGASTLQIICKVLLPEARPSLYSGCAIAITTILGYSAMAGAVGGGGLGNIAISYGYNRYQSDIMLVTVILLILIVQLFQEIGSRASRKTDKRK